MNRYKRPAAITYQNAPWTFRLIMLNIGIYALGSVMAGDRLFMYGLLDIHAVVVDNQWWRLLSASVLHADVLHLLFNMAGLLIFGSMLERLLSSKILLASFVVCGVGANIVVVAVMYTQDLLYRSVGASGAILGIIGTCAMTFWLMWRTNHNPVWKRLWQPMVVILGLQILVDLVSPNNSMITHIAGFGVGLLFGVYLFYHKGLQKFLY